MHRNLRLNHALQIFFKVITYTLVYLLFEALISRLAGRSLPVLAVFLGLLLIIPFQPALTNFFQKIVDKSFFRSFYRLKLLARSFNHDLNSSIEHVLLIEHFITFLNRAFGVENFGLLLNKGALAASLNQKQSLVPAEMLVDIPDGLCGKLFQECPAQFYQAGDFLRRFPGCRELGNEVMSPEHYPFVFPLKGPKEVIGVLYFAAPVRRYLKIPEVQEFLVQLFEKTAAVIENANVHSEIRRKSLESTLLLEIIKNISATLNLQEVLESIIENLSQLVTFDAAAIFLVDKDKKILQHSVARGYDEKVLNLISLKIDQGISGMVVRTRQGSIIADVCKSPDYYKARPETRSQITVPIISRDNAIGVLVLESNELGHFTRADLELLTVFSGLAAIALRNAQLYEDSVTKQRLESDLLVASRVQQALLPRRFPAVPGMHIEVTNIPSRIVGGDLYDLFRIGEEQHGIAIGDVSGKGAPAALLMALAYAGFKSLLKRIEPVATTIARFNNFLVETTASGYFVTFFYGVYNLSERTFTYSNAGHDAPIYLRGNGEVKYLDEGGTVLGFVANRKYVQNTIRLAAGDYLCLYTDGVTEVRNAAGEEFGRERLVNTLRENYGKPAREIKQIILDKVRDFAGKKSFDDDLTLLIVALLAD